jgi:hypothetical protein
LAGKLVMVVRQLCGHRWVPMAIARSSEQRNQADRLELCAHDACAN